MNITLIMGTAQKGCTWKMTQRFETLIKERSDCDIRVFTLPTDMPHFAPAAKHAFFSQWPSVPTARRRCPSGKRWRPVT